MLQDIRIRQRDYLIQMARILTQELDLDSLLWQVIQMSVDLVGGESGFVALYMEGTGWEIRTQMDIAEPTLKYIETYLDKLYERDISERDALLQINMLIKRVRSIPQMKITDGVGLPLVSHGRIIGIIVIFRNYECNFSLNDKVILKAFADQASIAVNNAFLYSENLKEKNRLDAIIKSAADGIIVLNISHCVEMINPSFERLLHITQAEAVGRHHDELISFAKISSGMELSDGEAGGWPFNRDSRLYVEGDLQTFAFPETIPVSITYTPVMTAENVIVNIIAMVQDISKFREADEIKNTFISTISHELKTPVAIIKGYASTLNLDDATWDSATIKDSLTVIEEEADRLTDMINDLLDASRLYSGALKMNKTDLNLPEQCAHLAAHMQKQTTRNTIVCNFPTDFPIVSGDEDRIQQVITNLISNAIKYAPDGEIRISGKVEEKDVSVSVSDEGPGLSAEDLHHVFERFYRAKATSNMAKGTGLGLFLCKAIIEGHGGQIRAENRTDGRGSIFTFTLPLEPAGRTARLDLHTDR